MAIAAITVRAAITSSQDVEDASRCTLTPAAVSVSVPTLSESSRSIAIARSIAGSPSAGARMCPRWTSKLIAQHRLLRAACVRRFGDPDRHRQGLFRRRNAGSESGCADDRRRRREAPPRSSVSSTPTHAFCGRRARRAAGPASDGEALRHVGRVGGLAVRAHGAREARVGDFDASFARPTVAGSARCADEEPHCRARRRRGRRRGRSSVQGGSATRRRRA